jgi:hypothetical protein
LAITWASIVLQHHVSSKSLVNELRNMRRWHKNIHIALTRSDYRELALHPVLDAIRLYKKTAKSTIKGMIAASFIFIALFIITPFFYSAEPVGANDKNRESQSLSSSDIEESAFKVSPAQREDINLEVAPPTGQESNSEDDKAVQDTRILDDNQGNSSNEVFEAGERGRSPEN